MTKPGIAWIPFAKGTSVGAALATGMKKLGYYLVEGSPARNVIRPDDVLFLANFRSDQSKLVQEAKEAGATVICIAPPALPSLDEANPAFCVTLDGPAGCGRWFHGGPSRWRKSGYSMQPMKYCPDGPVVFIPTKHDTYGLNRASTVQTPRMVQAIRDAFENDGKPAPNILTIKTDSNFANSAERLLFLKAQTHGARAVIGWDSNLLNITLLWGVPSYHMVRYYVNPAVPGGFDTVLANPEKLFTDARRLAGFQSAVWAQRHLSEIETGAAIVPLLELAKPKQEAA